MIWSAPKIWDGAQCWIIGGGHSIMRQLGVPVAKAEAICKRLLPPTALSTYFDPIKDGHIIGVNNVYQMGEWVDVLFFGDCGWHLVHQKALLKWPGLKVTCCNKFANLPLHRMEGIKYLPKNHDKIHGITTTPNKISWNANSGGSAINLAVHFGVKKILLLGFDMNADDNHTHWHGSHHPKSAKPPKLAFKRHLIGFPHIAEDAQRLGVEILNVNPDSAIDCFPKVELREVL